MSATVAPRTVDGVKRVRYPLRMVESVEGLEPQLEVLGLGDVDILNQRYVEVIDAGSVEKIAGDVSNTRAGGRHGEGSRIEIVIRRPVYGVIARIADAERHSRNAVGTVPESRRRCFIGRLGGERGASRISKADGEAVLEGRRAYQLPVIRQRAESMCEMIEGQDVIVAENKPLGRVVVRWPIHTS